MTTHENGATQPEDAEERRSLIQQLYPTPHLPNNAACICAWCRGWDW